MKLLPLAIVALAVAARAEPPISYQKFKFGRQWYHMIRADLRSPILAAEAIHSNGLIKPWKLIARREPIAAITGTFFAPRQGKAVADVLIDGKIVNRGSRGTAIGVAWDGSVKIFDQLYGQPTDWTAYQWGLRGAVRIVRAGKVRPNPQWERFQDRRIWGRAARTGVGVTKAGKLVLIATTYKVTLSQLGKAMKSRGVVDAINLDGGGSTCLYYKGKMIIAANRKLNNMFVISRRTAVAATAAESASLRTTVKR